MLLTNCTRCGKTINKEVATTDRFYYCKFCCVMIANPCYVKQELNDKGGKKMGVEEEVENVQKEIVQEQPQKPKITMTARVRQLMNDKLDIEISKIIINEFHVKYSPTRVKKTIQYIKAKDALKNESVA